RPGVARGHRRAAVPRDAATGLVAARSARHAGGLAHPGGGRPRRAGPVPGRARRRTNRRRPRPVTAATVLAQSGQPLIRWPWIGDHVDLILAALLQHLVMTFITVGIGFVLSMGLAVVALRFRVSFTPINAVTGVMYAIPSLALF